MPVYRFVCLAVALAFAAGPSFAQEDVKPGAPTFKEGDVVTYDKIEALKPFLPPEFWDNRDFFFYEGMQLEIGPSFADYGPPPVYDEATKKYSSAVKLGPESSLVDYRAGQPFPMDKIDCKGDPQAGAKVAWNFVRRWEGFGGTAVDFYYSYWDRGEELPLYYQGTSQGVAAGVPAGARVRRLRGRRVPEREALRGERPVGGRALRRARHHAALVPLQGVASARRRPRRTTTRGCTCRRCGACAASRRRSARTPCRAPTSPSTTCSASTASFPQYEWKCLGEMDILAPARTKVKAYPYEKNHNFGPYGLSFADDRWELRHAHQVPLHAAQRGPSVRPQGHLHRQELDGAALLLRLRPQEASSGRSSGTTIAGARIRATPSTRAGRTCPSRATSRW